MELDKYISDLLYRYDCVILPNLGAFIANRVATQIIESEGKIIPPRKEIIFNRHIKNNDGLLHHYIMNAKKISYKKAEELVSSEINRISQILEKGETVTFNNLGTIRKVDENNIEFTIDSSVNYLKSSYGLSTINAATVSSKQENSADKKQVLPISQSEPKGKLNFSSKITRYAAVAIPLLTLASLAYYHQLNEFNLNLNSAEISIISSEKKEIKKVEAAKEIKAEEITVEEITPVAEEKVVEERVKVNKVFNYHLVAGAFSSNKNAQKAIRKINSKGLEAEIIGQNKNGLYMVTYSSHQTISEAKEELGLVKIIDENNSAWIWKKSIEKQVIE